MPLVFTSGKYLYRAIITLYMLEIAPPVGRRYVSTLDSDMHTLTMTRASQKALIGLIRLKTLIKLYKTHIPF